MCKPCQSANDVHWNREMLNQFSWNGNELGQGMKSLCQLSESIHFWMLFLIQYDNKGKAWQRAT